MNIKLFDQAYAIALDNLNKNGLPELKRLQYMVDQELKKGNRSDYNRGVAMAIKDYQCSKIEQNEIYKLSVFSNSYFKVITKAGDIYTAKNDRLIWTGTASDFFRDFQVKV